MNRLSNVGIRVNLTLPADVVAVLDRIAKATGTGRATMVREVLIDGLPGLSEMAHALELAQKKNADGFKLLAKGIGDLANEAQQLEVEFKRTSRRMVRKNKA
jgi:predicted DNA-binding protein